MKKIIIFLSILLIVTGCGKKEHTNQVDTSYIFDTYQVAEPYKDPISKNYINNYLLNNYDIDNVQNSLMDLSTKYFKVNDNYYQSGQYLDNNLIKELLDIINPSEAIEIDGVSLIPNYISYIHEQNYLDKNQKLNGISLGIVINRYQAYQNQYGATLYKEISLEDAVDYTKNQIPRILEYVREKTNLNETRIIIGLYLTANPNSIIPGSYKYSGITSNNKVSLNEVNYEYYYLDSNELMNKNINIYNAFSSLKKDLKEYNAFVSGNGLFYENNLNKASITITTNYLTRDKLMMLEQDISDILTANFSFNSVINVYIKTNKEIVGIVTKNKNSTKISKLIVD